MDFPPTRWSLVLQAATGDDTGALKAMAELCEHYRPAIQSYFRMKCRDLGLTVNALYQAVFRLRHDYYERFRAE